jgi:hypothetical protein
VRTAATAAAISSAYSIQFSDAPSAQQPASTGVVAEDAVCFSGAGRSPMAALQYNCRCVLHSGCRMCVVSLNNLYFAVCFCNAGEMLDKLVGTLPPPKDMETVDEKEKPLAIAIVGRPNVGECIRSAFYVCMHAVQESLCWECTRCSLVSKCETANSGHVRGTVLDPPRAASHGSRVARMQCIKASKNHKVAACSTTDP